MLREEEMERERIWRGSVLHSLKRLRQFNRDAPRGSETPGGLVRTTSLGSKSYPQPWWSAELWYGRQVLLAPSLLIGVRHVLNAAVNGAAAAIAFISLLLLAAWLWSSYGF